MPSRTGPTLKDIARRAGVHESTVSVTINGARSGAVISEATRKRIREAANELKYRPNAMARGLARGRMNTLGIVAAGHRGDILLDHYTANVIQGVIDVATDRLQSTAIFHSILWSEVNEILPAYCDGRNDGLLLLTPEKGLIERMRDSHIPFVVIGENSQIGDFSSVDIDDHATTYALITHLFDNGHRRIAMVGGSGPCFSGRLRAFQAVHDDRGVPFNEDLILTREYKPDTFAEIRHALKAVLALPAPQRPTAVFGYTDKFAISAVRTIRECGLRVPQDISVVGIDDAPDAQAMDLTTMRQNPRLAGVRAAEILLEMIDKKTAPGFKEFLPTELVIRGSVANVLPS